MRFNCQIYMAARQGQDKSELGKRKTPKPIESSSMCVADLLVPHLLKIVDDSRGVENP